MKGKRIIIAVLACTVMSSLAIVLTTWTQNTLAKEEMGFDLDRDGELSMSEKELMVRVMRLEDARGTQFSGRQIRELQGGWRDGGSRRKGGFGRRGSSRGPSGPRLDPEQVQFKDGAAIISDRETFKKLWKLSSKLRTKANSQSSRQDRGENKSVDVVSSSQVGLKQS